MAYDKYRTYWEKLKTEIIELLSSQYDESKQLGMSINDIVKGIESESKKELFNEYS